MRNWVQICERYQIEYGFSGKNNIVVHCPFCGTSDHGQHLAISLLGRGWRCLRNPQQHRGLSYVRLACGLLKCSEAQAKDLLGVTDATPLPDADEFSASWRKQLGLAAPSAQARGPLAFPPEFKRLAGSRSRFAEAFWDYLGARGYTGQQAAWVAETYDLHYAVTGKYAYRVIVPIYDERGTLMNWTARSIRADEKVRYRGLPSAEAAEVPTNLVLGLPLLWAAQPAKCLVCCEGPFDALAVSALGHRQGVWGTCFFGVEVSTAQSELLAQLQQRFTRLRLLVDPDMSLRVLRLRTKLPAGCSSAKLLDGLKDPGELVGAGAAGVDFVQQLAA